MTSCCQIQLPCTLSFFMEPLLFESYLSFMLDTLHVKSLASIARTVRRSLARTEVRQRLRKVWHHFNFNSILKMFEVVIIL